MSGTALEIGKEWIGKLASLGGDARLPEILAEHPELADADSIRALCSEVNRLIWSDAEQARRLAASVRRLAEMSGDEPCRALAARAAANAHHNAGENETAQELYAEALGLFERLGEDREAAITRSSSLLNLAYLGEYERVTAWETAARATFERLRDRLRLAILENNYANILYRQDRWEEALERYTLAYEEFVQLGRSQDAAVCLRNISVCQISLHNFDEALAAYERNRAYCEGQGLRRLVLYVDYNIAYLYYLRGEYTRAIQLYKEARRRCDEEGDAYHKALCDLDEAEIYLELNLVEEAAELSRSAFAGFESLRLPYESGKALTNSAIALSRQGKGEQALAELESAREIFVREKNPLWPPLIDFYRAVVLYREARPAAAVQLAVSAREAFARTSRASKAAMCELLMAELQLALERPHEARRSCEDAFDRLADLELPALEHQAHLVLGQVEEALGHRREAIEAYRRSLSRLDKLRSQLQGEDLKIAFLSDKGVVYEGLVWLTLQDPEIPARNELVFEYIEQSRSRSLADLMAFRAHDLPARQPNHRDLTGRVRQLREELNWDYRQIDLRQMNGGERSLGEVVSIRRHAKKKEDALLRELRELRAADQELGALQTGGVSDLETVRASLPDDAVLLEYFIVRGHVLSCLVARDVLEIVPLTSVERAQEIHRRLQFQLSRSMLGPEHLGDTLPLVHEATHAHLEDLYAELVAPLAPRLDAEHLVVVPHGFLHYVPFHALADGESYLIDRFSISYAPSASVFHLCSVKETAGEEKSLVLGVADERAPFIADEARAVAELLPRATLLLGEEATEEALRHHGRDSRFVHIAAHGLFRRDNPMFSAIQLGPNRLSLFDLYDLELSAELVVLSGCGTGLNAVLGTDELVGLTRGFLYAGAQSILVSLWDVNDASTELFMRHFYEHLGHGMARAAALRRTMLDLRSSHPSPYHWAPFVLVGKPA